MNDATAAAPAVAQPKKRGSEKISMADGRDVEFLGEPGKDKNLQRFSKDLIVVQPDGSAKAFDDLSEDETSKVNVGQLATRFDFRNGTTRTYPINPSLALRFAGHGALQKYGDQLAGETAEDLDDWAASTDALHEQLKAGQWAKARVGGGFAGQSILMRALIEYTGRTEAEIKEHTKDWTPQVRQQMRMDPDIKPIVDRLEAERAAKATKVDTSALKAGLKALAA